MTSATNLRGIAPRLLLLIFLVRPAAGIELGVLAGATISRFSSADLSWDFGLGYTAGLFADLRLNRWLRLQPQLRFTAVGSSAVIPIRQTGIALDVNISKTVQAVELPIILRLAPVVREKIKPNLQVGACLAANVRGRERLRFRDQSSSENIDDEINKKIQAGFLAGIGADFSAGRIPFYFSCLWRGGFPWLARNFIQQKIRSNGLIISLGVGF
jgi:hypothetical protein